MGSLTTKEILTMLEAGTAKSKELGQSHSIAIIDTGGNLVGFIRPEGASLDTIRFAQAKAWTSAATQVPSEFLGPMIQPGSPGFGCNMTEPRMFAIPSGYPITKDGKTFLGGIGTSGGPIPTDVEVSIAALKAGGFKTTGFPNKFAPPKK